MGKSKATKALDRNKALELLEAIEFASRIGKPLNYMLTVHFGKLDGGDTPRQRLGKMRERASKYLKRRGLQLTDAWVMEHSLSAEQHCHVLIHLPDHLAKDFEAKLPSWIGGCDDTQAVHMRPADHGGRAYILKDIQVEFYGELGVWLAHRQKRSMRPVIGKRCGTSENIGRAARTRCATQAHPRPVAA